MSFNGREGEHPIKTHSTNPSNNNNANSNSHSQYNNISTNQNRKTSTSNELQSLSHLLQIQSRARAIIEQEDEKKRAIIEHEDEKKRIQQKYDEEQKFESKRRCLLCSHLCQEETHFILHLQDNLPLIHQLSTADPTFFLQLAWRPGTGT